MRIKIQDTPASILCSIIKMLIFSKIYNKALSNSAARP
jgi:hypothetical protein